MNTNVQPPSKPRYDSNRTMMACRYHGKENLKMEEVPFPMLTDSTDAVVKVTASTICGSDLHLYHGMIPETEDGDILGHESVGIIEDAGTGVSKFKKGDRVVISAIIACGQCEHCQLKQWSCCNTTNSSKLQKTMYGHNTSGIFGYSHTMGGYDGCQAEYVRVPFADVNLFPIPNDVTDKQALVIADIASTGYHGTELARVTKGDNVVVIGCGPVGLMAQMWSKFRGANLVIAIDVDSQRLDFARKNFGVETINSKEENVRDTVKKMLPNGPEKVIDCVGFRPNNSLLEKVEQTLSLETDISTVVNTAIEICKTCGTVALIGDYVDYTNHFNIGAMMEKHLTIRGGQQWPHSYYQIIFDAMKTGLLDPTVVFTHTFPLSKCSDAYKVFDEHQGGIIKPFLVPDALFHQSMSS